VRVKSKVAFEQYDWNSRCALSQTRIKMHVNERNISLKSANITQVNHCRVTISVEHKYNSSEQGTAI